MAVLRSVLLMYHPSCNHKHKLWNLINWGLIFYMLWCNRVWHMRFAFLFALTDRTSQLMSYFYRYYWLLVIISAQTTWVVWINRHHGCTLITHLTWLFFPSGSVCGSDDSALLLLQICMLAQLWWNHLRMWRFVVLIPCWKHLVHIWCESSSLSLILTTKHLFFSLLLFHCLLLTTNYNKNIYR